MAFLIILIVFFWGIWGFVEKFALFYGSPWQTMFAFLVCTAVLFLPFTVIMLLKKQGRVGFKINHWVWIWIFLAVFTDLLAVLALRFAFLNGATGIVIAVTAIYPIITAILSVMFLNEKISKWQYFGIGIVCLGLFLLSV